jgi:hypothetical protein
MCVHSLFSLGTEKNINFIDFTFLVYFSRFFQENVGMSWMCEENLAKHAGK